MEMCKTHLWIFSQHIMAKIFLYAVQFFLHKPRTNRSVNINKRLSIVFCNWLHLYTYKYTHIYAMSLRIWLIHRFACPLKHESIKHYSDFSTLQALFWSPTIVLSTTLFRQSSEDIQPSYFCFKGDNDFRVNSDLVLYLRSKCLKITSLLFFSCAWTVSALYFLFKIHCH